MKKSIQNGREGFLLPVLVIFLMILIHSNPMNLPTEEHLPQSVILLLLLPGR